MYFFILFSTEELLRDDPSGMAGQSASSGLVIPVDLMKGGQAHSEMGKISFLSRILQYGVYFGYLHVRNF